MKSRASVKRLAALALVVAVLPLSTIDGTGWAPNVLEGSDIVMKDHRWPVWDLGTYYCFWYMSFVPRHPRLGNFYGGIATKGPDKPPGMFMSYWGENDTIHTGEYFYRHGYGAEGASGGAHGKALFLRPGSWYRFVMRAFPPTEDADKRTCVGWWVKDVEKDRWHTHSVVVLPAHAAGFRGNSGFVEALAPESVKRAFERRLGYCRVDGQWYKSNEVTTSAPSQFKLIEDGTVLRFDRPVENDEGSRKAVFTTRQADTPALDRPEIEQVEARAWRNQVTVRWTVPTSASPQLGYRIEVFARRGAKGTPLAVAEDAAPHILARRLDVAKPAKSVRLTVTDIFDQKETVVIPVARTTLDAAARTRKLRHGLEYSYYEPPGRAEWDRLPDFAKLTPVRQGHVTALDDTVRQDRDKLYGIRYRGYLKAPADGLYVFSAGTCDGSRMAIDGKVIADNDGIHSASVKQYPISLEAGMHAFELEYFKGPSRRHHKNLPDKISISWEGPGFALRKLARDDFMCEDTGAVPSVALGIKGAEPGGVLADNLVDILAKTDLHGHRLTNLQLFSGHMLLRDSRNAEPDGEGGLAFRVLFPSGANRIWARLWYDGSRSVDSGNALEFETREVTEGPWKFVVLGHKFPIAVRYKDGRASFTGEGFYVGCQKVSGDFTLTARIADITLTTAENGVHGSNWLGLYTSDVKRPKKGHGFESTFNQWGFGIYLTAGRGMKGSADFPDLGGGRMCIPSFPKDHRWLRIVRRGKRFQSFTSADGETWLKAMERVSQRRTAEQYAGVSFRAVPGKGRGLFQGAFDNISLERGEVPEEDVLFTALGYRQFKKQTRPKEWRLKSTTYAAPFSGRRGSPVYGVRERTTGRWSIVSSNAKVDGRGAEVALNEGISCILPDKDDADTLYLCNRHGIFKTTSGGKTYWLVCRSPAK